jgi:ribose 5-phosphate isomerase B
MNTLFFACDHAGFDLKKEIVKSFFVNPLYKIVDLGCYDNASYDYPDLAHKLCETLSFEIEKEYKAFGVLICGTGIGMSIVANRYSTIRASLCSNPYEAKCAREHNDCNVLCLGARVVGVGVAMMCLDLFLNTPFLKGRHEERLKKIKRD